MEPTRTERASSSTGDTGVRLVCWLIRIGQSDRLRSPEPRIIDLGELDELRLGRGHAEQLEELGARGYRWSLVDAWMSGDHAAVVRQGGSPEAFDLVDQKSTNGCFVNGRRVSRHRLRDGDVLEVGQSFFSFFCGAVHDPQELLELAYSGGGGQAHLQRLPGGAGPVAAAGGHRSHPHPPDPAG